MGKYYVVSFDGHNYDNGIFNSYDEAMKEGLESSLGDFYIAEADKFTPHTNYIGERVLEMLLEDAYEDCGEAAEDWFCDLTDAEVEELNKKLGDAILNFVEEHQTFQLYTIENPKMIERTD